MKKDTQEVKIEETNNVAKANLDPKEAKETLRVQLKQHSEQADFHKTMALKAQGALEVLMQLHPEDSSDDS